VISLKNASFEKISVIPFDLNLRADCNQTIYSDSAINFAAGSVHLPLRRWDSKRLRQRSTPVIVGWFADSTLKNSSKWNT
jgi:hypothetical protein